MTLIDEINQWADKGFCRKTEDMLMIEVGAFAGESTVIFSEHFKDVWSVDPWQSGSGDITNFVDMDQVFEVWISENQKGIGDSPTYSRIEFKKFCEDRPGIQADLIYIDALHDYDSVKADIELSRGVLAPGGIIAGHDYCDRFMGVMMAVDEAFDRPDIVTSDTSWFKIIKDIKK